MADLETAFDVVNRQTGEVVGTAYLTDDRQLQRFEPKAQPQPAPETELYRIVWWQSLIQGLAQGETLETDVPREQLDARVLYWRVTFKDAVGVMVGSCPMSFVPAGDHREE